MINSSLFLIILSLMLPRTFFYPVSLQELKKKVSTFMSKESIERLTPAAFVAIGLAGGLYYYVTRMHKKNDDDVDFKKSRDSDDSSSNSLSDLLDDELSTQEPEIPFNDKKILIKQFDVYSQTNEDGGGSASCGYHTLLRAMQIVAAKSKGEADEELKKTLLDTSTINLYFGNIGHSFGVWRQMIIERRKDIKFLELLREKLNESFNETRAIENYNEKIMSLYRNLINDLGKEIADIFRKRDSLKDYEITPDQVIKVFSTGKYRSEDHPYIKDNDTIKRYVNVEKIVNDLSNTSFNIPEDKSKGDWLSDGELEFLWKEINEDNDNRIIPKGVDCKFNPIANPNLIGDLDVDSVTPTIKKELQKKDYSGDLFYVFAIGTMKHIGYKSGTDGHWYPLVLHKKVDGSLEYFITDSMKNGERINGESVVKLIETLETR